jgi:hypothetical protein
MHMKKIQIKLLVIFSLAIVLVFSSQTFAQTPPSPTAPPDVNSFFNTSFWQNVAVAVLSAILAFLSGYALAGMSKRQRSGKKLSYSLSIENGLVKIEKDIRKRVKVFYNSEEIENLYNVNFDVENTGNTVIKSQEIRFEFPEETRILDFSFEPEPEQEMKVEKIETGLRTFEKKCKIGQIERGQNLGVRFTATSTAEIGEIKLHPYNEGGDIEFASRSITKALSDRDHIAKFLSLYILYLVVPPVLYLFPVIGEMMTGLARFVILISLFRLIIPFSEIIADIVFKLISKSEEGRIFNINGDVSNAVFGGENGNYQTYIHGENEGASSKK